MQCWIQWGGGGGGVKYTDFVMLLDPPPQKKFLYVILATIWNTPASRCDNIMAQTSFSNVVKEPRSDSNIFCELPASMGSFKVNQFIQFS